MKRNFISYFKKSKMSEKNLKHGSIVARKSYKKDILFIIDRIIKTKNNDNIAILKGLTVRIVADSPLSDLVLINKPPQDNYLNKFNRSFIQSDAIILHLDGDRRYSEKSAKYYKQAGLKAIVKNIPENKQANFIKELLERYKPDILVITGHDAMLKNGSDKNNIYNYRNSKYFINTVREARKWANSSEKLVIFAGACQSYFEAIMNAGADFASSPGRILIDFIDPLIVAQKIATTDVRKYISINDIASFLSSGTNGISGTIVRGKKNPT